MFINTYGFLLLVVISAWSVENTNRFHALKMSTCLITCDAETDYMRVQMHFFEDDFEAHLNTIGDRQISLDQSSEVTNAQIQNYIKERFKISFNGQMQNLQFKEAYKKDIIEYVEFSIPNCACSKQRNISIQNSLLIDAFDQQTNLVRLDLIGDKNFKTLRFNRKELELTCNF